MSRRIILYITDVVILVALAWLFVSLAAPMWRTGDWFGVALVFILCGAAWAVVKGEGV